MSSEEIARAFSNQVIIDVDESDETTIEFSDFENSRTKLPPLATATVYETKLLRDDNLKNFDRHDSFGNFQDDDENSNHGSDDSDSDSDCSLDDDEEIIKQLQLVDNCLKDKVTEILMENPWLASRIVQKQNGKYAMKFRTELSREDAEKQSLRVVRIVTTIAAGRCSAAPGTPSSTKRSLTASHAPSAMDVIIADPITEDTYHEIVDSIRPLLHKSTESVAGEKKLSLWNVLLIPLRMKETFARSTNFLLVHSLDSCLADPATLYKIYGMVSANEQVERLDPTRCKNIDKIKKKILGGDPNFLRSTGIQTGKGKRKTLKKLDSTAFELRTSVWTVNDDRIDSIKQRHEQKKEIRKKPEPIDAFSLDSEPEVDYISTNDILTSWFLSRNKDAAIGCLLADLRGRDPKIHSHKAGNYQAEIIYNTRDDKFHDARTPSWIRASLNRTTDELWKRHKDRSLPSILTLSGGVSKSAPGVTIVSNWSNLCQTLALEHDGIVLKAGIHLPIVLEAPGASYGWSSLLIFRYTEDKLGVVITAPSSATKGLFIPLDRPAVFEE